MANHLAAVRRTGPAAATRDEVATAPAADEPAKSRPARHPGPPSRAVGTASNVSKLRWPASRPSWPRSARTATRSVRKPAPVLSRRDTGSPFKRPGQRGLRLVLVLQGDVENAVLPFREEAGRLRQRAIADVGARRLSGHGPEQSQKIMRGVPHLPRYVLKGQAAVEAGLDVGHGQLLELRRRRQACRPA